jgi:hypothetical protein
MTKTASKKDDGNANNPNPSIRILVESIAITQQTHRGSSTEKSLEQNSNCGKRHTNEQVGCSVAFVFSMNS